MTEISFDEVKRTWDAAGGPPTPGILFWFQPIVVRWTRETLRAGDIGDLLLMGSEAGGQFDQPTRGTFRVRDGHELVSVSARFAWDSTWALVTVRNLETGQRVLLDGNKRALAVSVAVTDGILGSETPVDVITGDVHPAVVLASKALSSLWR